MVYAGIGSRATPPAILDVMTRVAVRLREDGWLLRTGGASGADDAFYAGAGRSAAELYLPWPGYNGHHCEHTEPSYPAFRLAAEHHPAWPRLGVGARRLHARNCEIVLGEDLASPVRFVVCWTADGTLDGTGRRSGGTGQALRLAAAYGIPAFNLRRAAHLELVVRYLARGPVAQPDRAPTS